MRATLLAPRPGAPLLPEGVRPDCTLLVEPTAAATEPIVGLGGSPPAPFCAIAAAESVEIGRAHV